MGAAPPLYDVTDLHALADDELDEATAARLRKVLSPGDTARVAQWRRQNELMRAAFLRIAQEPVPLPLSLLPQPRPPLRAVVATPAPVCLTGRRNVGTVVALGCAMAAAVAAVFLLSSGLDMPNPALPPAVSSADQGRLAARTVALAGEASLAATSATELHLPNLAAVGLTLESSEAHVSDAGLSACGLYKDRFGARFALCAMSISGAGDAAPAPVAARAVGWRDADRAYSLAGPLPAGELTAVAAKVRAALKAP